jgi:predicted transposase YdaD
MFTCEDLKKTRYYQEVREEVREELQQEVREELQQQFRQKEAQLLIRQLVRRIGAVNPQLQERIHQLSIVQLENLAEALLDFSTEVDLATWLDENSNQSDEQ